LSKIAKVSIFPLYIGISGVYAFPEEPRSFYANDGKLNDEVLQTWIHQLQVRQYNINYYYEYHHKLTLIFSVCRKGHVVKTKQN